MDTSRNKDRKPRQPRRSSRGANKRKPGARRRIRWRRPQSRKEWAIFSLKWAAVGGLALAAIGAASVAMMFWIYGSDPALPQISKIEDYRPSQVSRVYSADGKVIGEIYTQRRTVVPYDKLPEVLIQAFVAAEDANFWEHEGIDYVGMVRALFVNLKSGEKKQGASTITQQVVKNLLLTRARTLKRKVQEIILARRLEKELTKEEILTLYANEIYFGNGRYGVQEAARYYFGKDVEDLNVGEAAVLAGLPKGPNLYSPKPAKNAERAKQRQIYVLSQMVANGFIDVEEAQKWIDEPIKIVADPYPHLGAAPEWVELARKELVERYGEEELDKLGADITTTVDLEAQAVARRALQAGLRAYDERKGYGHPYRKVKKDKIDLELAKLAKRLPEGGPKAGEVYPAVVVGIHDDDQEIVVDLGDHRGSILLGTAADERYDPDAETPDERFSIGDVVRVTPGKVEDESRAPKHAERQLRFAPGPEGAVVVLDPKTRKLVALVGGYQQDVGDFNRATQAARQAGSTFKPFVYAAAVDSGEFTAASIVNDAPEVYEDVGDLWKPENYKKGEFAGPVRLRYALAKSINTVAIRVTHDITPERVREVAKSLGIQSELPATLSLALGSGEVTPLELTNAFASFAAGGLSAPARAVETVGGEPVEPAEPAQVLRPEVAYVIVNMMRSVITEGTGARAGKLPLDIVGKTGTSNDTRDAWFVGMSADLVVGVWVGFDDFSRELGRGEGGSRTALPIFVGVMEKLGDRGSRFVAPPGVVEARIDEKTGLLAAEGQVEGAYTEVFLDGTVPVEVAPAPGEVDVGSAIFDQYGGLGFGDPAPAEPEVAPSP